jgi:hypothetical protein
MNPDEERAVTIADLLEIYKEKSQLANMLMPGGLLAEEGSPMFPTNLSDRACYVKDFTKGIGVIKIDDTEIVPEKLDYIVLGASYDSYESALLNIVAKEDANLPNFLQWMSQNRCNIYTQVKSCCRGQQGVSPELHTLSLMEKFSNKLAEQRLMCTKYIISEFNWGKLKSSYNTLDESPYGLDSLVNCDKTAIIVWENMPNDAILALPNPNYMGMRAVNDISRFRMGGMFVVCLKGFTVIEGNFVM